MLSSISSISSLAALGFEHLLQNHTWFYNVLCFLESRFFIYTLYFGFVFVLKTWMTSAFVVIANTPHTHQHPSNTPHTHQVTLNMQQRLAATSCMHMSGGWPLMWHIMYAHVQRLPATSCMHMSSGWPLMFRYHLRYIVYAHAQRMTAHVLAATTRIKHYGLCVTLDVSKYP